MSLDHLKTDTTIENETNNLGIGVLDSALYDFVVDMAYFNKSQGGANSFNLHLKDKNGATLRTTLWITSGDAKGNKNYYTGQDGAKRYLPGFNQANALCMLSIGKEISELIPEAKTVKIYDFDAKKELPKEMQVATELLGAEISCGVIKQLTDVNVKNDQGVYVPTGKTREENEIDKCFRTADYMTVAELRAKETTPAFKDKWVAKNTGNVRDKSAAKKGAVAGTPGKTSAPATESLFT